MRIVTSTPLAIDEALAILARGGVVVHATETCYGMTCDLSNLEAVRRLFDIKRRPEHQPVSALFASVDRAREYVEWPAMADQLARRYLPGPLTLLLPLKIDAPPISLAPQGGTDSVGVRISSHPLALELSQRYPKPISTTSANVHGRPEAYSVSTMLKQFDGGPAPDLVIDGGLLPRATPSTVVRVEGEVVTVVRQGGLRIA